MTVPPVLTKRECWARISARLNEPLWVGTTMIALSNGKLVEEDILEHSFRDEGFLDEAVLFAEILVENTLVVFCLSARGPRTIVGSYRILPLSQGRPLVQPGVGE